MSEQTKSVVIGGIVLGILYLVDVFVDLACESLLFPIIGGALTVFLYSRNSSDPVDVSEGAKLGALAAVLGGLILIVVGTPLVYFVLRAVTTEQIEAQLRQAGLEIPFSGVVLILLGALILSVIGLIIATISGMVTALILKKR